ncbi:Hypothetical protein FKW44_012851 [Caligus rogercresseyi]|uniref:Uncharacterized protein n=1 Tax=Caligus rogercresseyi TaxID=217165 RepID=A0A7T8K9V0_CALRO|nr:Hypothetical protein FKW44_012851 [Caligus rogercresseyi]
MIGGKAKKKRHFSLHHQGWGRELHPSDEMSPWGQVRLRLHHRTPQCLRG